MVKIRLSRTGAKKRPFYHVVATDSRKARDGRYLERLGFYNPIAKGEEVMLKIEDARLTYWQENGAQLTERVANLLKEQKAKDSEVEAA
jgi:small subunit ribosomal protein S16